MPDCYCCKVHDIVVGAAAAPFYQPSTLNVSAQYAIKSVCIHITVTVTVTLFVVAQALTCMTRTLSSQIKRVRSYCVAWTLIGYSAAALHEFQLTDKCMSMCMACVCMCALV